MNSVRKGVLLGALQVLLVLSLGAKLLYDRLTRPRVWVLAAVYDPELPIRGRYIAERLQMPTEGFKYTGPVQPNGSDWFNNSEWAYLEVHNGQLFAYPQGSGSAEWVHLHKISDGTIVALSQEPVFAVHLRSRRASAAEAGPRNLGRGHRAGEGSAASYSFGSQARWRDHAIKTGLVVPIFFRRRPSCRNARCGFEPALHLIVVHQAGLLSDHAAAGEHHEVGDAVDVEAPRKLRIFFRVHFQHHRTARHVRGSARHFRSSRDAWPAPPCPEIHEHGNRRIFHDLIE